MEKKQKKSANKKSKKGKKEIDMSAFDSNSGTLARVKWSRVVLDESQTIKNHRTQVARACCSLRAKRRWCLSGTPIQNSVDELFSYFRFLRYDPYDKYKTFGSSIKALISRDSVKGYKKLQVVLRNIMLRRTKDQDDKPVTATANMVLASG
ncbi:Helicase-like transcription factor CHR28 [Sesamum angolense]|uniref:Helicase-like transcription factor CHR28 n=1 Tax=Sesamum angolense TaxID=2727404 RepID=A0AAE2BSC2_9LAMI|nr:Helicase-like transcription factor CHR28 [Sesamum angolense]